MTAWRSASRAVLLPWLVTRGSVLLVGYLAARFIGFDPLPVEQAAWRESTSTLLNLPARWDAFWYLDIARHGYHWDPATTLQQNVVFFPAYPLLVAGAGRLLGGHLLAAGMAASISAFYLALLYFRRLAADMLGEAGADRAVWLLALYPSAVFFGAIYTESLFLLLLVATFWHGRRGEWGRAAVWGTLLGLTRPNGFLMALPLAALALGRVYSRDESGAMAEGRGLRRIPWLALLAAASPAIGMLGYSAFLWWTFGHPFIWVTGQAAWGTFLHPGTPPDPRWGPPLPSRYSDFVVHGSNAAAAVFALFSVRPISRRWGAPFGLLVAIAMVPPLVSRGTMSMARFTSVLFPLFLWLAAGPAAARPGRWLTAFAVGQAVAAALFFSWRLLV